ncbi:MAG: C40 family peptidase [Gaiellaceae bacterium]
MSLRLRTLALCAVALAGAATCGSARADGPVFAIVANETASEVVDVASQDAALAEQLDEFLRGESAPLAGMGSTFVAAGRSYGIDPRYLVALSGAESSFGKFLFRPFNPFGWGSYDFTSWNEAIYTVARGLHRGYLSEGRTAVSSISEKYAPVGADNDPNQTNGEHPHNISAFLLRLGGNPDDVRLGATPAAPPFLPTFPGVGPANTMVMSSPGERAASLALEYVGVPYVWGGESPSGFDCSGLTMFVYAQLGVSLSHWTGDQVSQGRPVERTDLQPGDLIFFDVAADGVPGHMGMYVGVGLFVHAPHSGDVVKVSPFDARYQARFSSAIRPY